MGMIAAARDKQLDKALERYQRGKRGRRQVDEAEHREAVALMQWCQLHEARYPELALIYAIPNGGIRQRGMAGKMKAEGVKRGVPDYHLPVARAGYHSLYIELKATGGRLTTEQHWWAEELTRRGNKWVCALGWQRAADALNEYLQEPI